MNTMPGNPHADDTFWDRIDAETNAVFALAFEQRTANLIALHDTLKQGGSPTEANELLNSEIKSRLGLPNTN